MGAEALDRRLTVMITASMEERLMQKGGGRVAAFVRAAISRALGKRGRGYTPKRRRRSSKRGVSRYNRG